MHLARLSTVPSPSIFRIHVYSLSHVRLRPPLPECRCLRLSVSLSSRHPVASRSPWRLAVLVSRSPSPIEASVAPGCLRRLALLSPIALPGVSLSGSLSLSLSTCYHLAYRSQISVAFLSPLALPLHSLSSRLSLSLSTRSSSSRSPPPL